MEFQKNLKKQKGITLVEIVIVVFIIVLFTAILITDFPKIQAQFNLSRAAYKLAQDLRRAQDLSLSGVLINNGSGQQIKIGGYGIYFNPVGSTVVNGITVADNKTYSIYADSCRDQKYTQNNELYTPPGTDSSQLCVGGDYLVDAISIGGGGVSIKGFGIGNINGSSTSIDFTPPNPLVSIQDLCQNCKSIDIILGLDNYPSQTRTVSVNKSGLIEVK